MKMQYFYKETLLPYDLSVVFSLVWDDIHEHGGLKFDLDADFISVTDRGKQVIGSSWQESAKLNVILIRINITCNDTVWLSDIELSRADSSN